jgi:hypothetical protein
MAVKTAQAFRRKVRQELARRQQAAPGPTLSQLSAAFAPTFVPLPPSVKAPIAAKRIRATASAARRIAAKEGITFQAAGVRLREIAKEARAQESAKGRGSAGQAGAVTRKVLMESLATLYPDVPGLRGTRTSEAIRAARKRLLKGAGGFFKGFAGR